ncbi:MAG: UDP-N-acetylmuramate--L-alanine ligase [Alphaproteobacteria bacterium]|nr:UDP-N-acetylmuramate--L-alanine ligase [Alphaproteobacteria bacterium]
MSKTIPFPIGTVHIIGIGGIGMSGYAELLHNLGYAVQGSDQKESANTDRLKTLGIRIMIGHAPDNVRDASGSPCAVVVKSTAVKDSNPEIIAARKMNVQVIPRVALLAELMRNKWCINISGTHGKTTTTSLVGAMLEQAALSPTVINGGIINAYGSNTRLGMGKWMVVESDESDGTFAKLPSMVSVITNIDPEHLDYYGTFDALKQAFLDYVEQLPFYGIAVACSDHPVVRELLPQFKRKTITYGTDDMAQVKAENIRMTPEGLLFDIKFSPNLMHYPKCLRDVRLPMYGPHNVLNALAAFAAGHDIGIPAETTAEALSKFSGVKRRFTTTGIVDDITIIDDYAHHPAEIISVLKAGRQAVSGHSNGRVIAIAQPHRYSRLKSLFDEFCTCFTDADTVIVADVYPAGEDPIEGANRDTLAAGIKKTGIKDVRTINGPDELPALIRDIARPGDFVIFLGAGNITQWAYALPPALEEMSRKSGTQ